ncbi:MAG TPA: glycine zipper 2TM domain-containing protein [Albitalea sp.]|nr:glycine zipper 2TM domain-containing protein [Albitalea sp.]
MRSSFKRAGMAVFIVLSVLSAGCATRQPASGYPAQGGYYGTQYGTVQSIDVVRAQSQTSGGGAIVGGALGGLLGHQIDHGARKAFATGVGVVAGAIIGNEIEKNNKGYQDLYRVTVRLDQGGLRSFDYASLNDLRIGDRVRVENNQLYR